MAVDWMVRHPEYHGDLESPEAMTAEYSVEKGRTNPFLHLSMHLAIAEQLSIDHPRASGRAYQRLVVRSDAHQAVHEIMECLGQVVWEAQRLGTPMDSDTYLERDPPARGTLRKTPGTPALLPRRQVAGQAGQPCRDIIDVGIAELHRERAHDGILADVGGGGGAGLAAPVSLQRMRQEVFVLALPGSDTADPSASWRPHHGRTRS